ncbi:hypothetical protein [Amycolatopsis magusensis]|uniref:Uncharacterized protein n=1 Tax=Amycolatopsis magusensis TaxID=882444 RepID=A0ABS4Q5B4_9PSEU|nr:hypothetical protein [Amycolatopsis magusensis]MBP2186872.1 hypothetical protein [Amycolatopsis magusensis]
MIGVSCGVRATSRTPSGRCASEPVTLADYIAGIGDSQKTIDELVGDLQRIWSHAAAGFTIEFEVLSPVMGAYDRLADAGFVSLEAPLLIVNKVAL